jgi:hypothetical protein
MKLADYLCGILRPYADRPDFVLDIIEAMQKLGYVVTSENPIRAYDTNCNS